MISHEIVIQVTKGDKYHRMVTYITLSCNTEKNVKSFEKNNVI